MNIARIVKIALRHPNADFKRARDIEWHGCQAKPATPNTPPAFRTEKSLHKAHGGGVYVTPAFEHAVGYAFSKWDDAPICGLHRADWRALELFDHHAVGCV